MGQKTHPYGFRLGVIKTWKSTWFEDKQYADWLHQDLALKRTIRKKFSHAGIADIEIERAANKAKVVIYTSRPGIIIGKRGAGVEQLKGELQKLTENELFVDIQEIRKAETNAKLVAENIATQLERGVEFAEPLDKVPGERVVVIDEQDHEAMVGRRRVAQGMKKRRVGAALGVISGAESRALRPRGSGRWSPRRRRG